MTTSVRRSIPAAISQSAVAARSHGRRERRDWSMGDWITRSFYGVRVAAWFGNRRCTAGLIRECAKDAKKSHVATTKARRPEGVTKTSQQSRILGSASDFITAIAMLPADDADGRR